MHLNSLLLHSPLLFMRIHLFLLPCIKAVYKDILCPETERQNGYRGFRFSSYAGEEVGAGLRSSAPVHFPFCLPSSSLSKLAARGRRCQNLDKFICNLTARIFPLLEWVSYRLIFPCVVTCMPTRVDYNMDSMTNLTQSNFGS